MIAIKNVTKSFGSQLLFDDIDLQINTKEKVGLVGRNGHGKSTLFRLIDQKDSPDDGEIKIPEHYRIASLEQHINFTKQTVLEEASLGLHATEEHEVWQAEKMLSGLGFSIEDQKKDPQTFSGGFQMRINLAKVLLSAPNLLLLDEPTNYLDIVSLRWLVKFLRQWPGEIFLISHDRDFMEQVCTHTAAIYRQKIKKIKGSVTKLWNQIKQDEDIYEKTRLNDAKERTRQEKFIREFRAGARSAGLVQSRIKMLEKQDIKQSLTAHSNVQLNFKSEPFNSDILFKAHNISFGYTEDKKLIDKFSINIEYGEKIGIIGRNGLGKSTLLKLLAGMLKTQSGKIKTYQDLKIGYFGQTNQKTLDPQKNILEELQQDHNLSDQDARQLAGNLMFPDGNAYKKIEVLSGGEKSRVSLGKILATPAHMIMLDEPTNHLDLESCDSLIEAVAKFEGAAFLVSHNEHLLRKIAQKLIVFDNGKVIIFNGTYDQFLEEQGFSEDIGINLKNKPKSSKNTDQNISKEKRKQQTKLTRPLKKELNKIEKKIKIQEDQRLDQKEALKIAKKQGKLLQIDTLTIELQKTQKEIEECYENWVTLQHKLEEAEANF